MALGARPLRSPPLPLQLPVPSSSIASPASSSVSLVPSEIAVPSDTKEESEETKFKQLLGLLKKTVGVKDLGAIRLSLPATLLTPIPNLEYWCYLDRPDLFAAIPDSHDPLERILAVLRWTFSKDSKFIHYGLCKPYNSVLGERFRCIYDVTPVSVNAGSLIIHEDTPPAGCYLNAHHVLPISSAPQQPENDPAAVLSSDSEDGCFHDATESPTSPPNQYQLSSQTPDPSKPPDSPQADRPKSLGTSSTMTTSPGAAVSSQVSTASTAATSTSSVHQRGNRRARVAFLNEQVSHHPPVSYFYCESRIIGDTSGKGKVVAYGIDQISAKFTGASVKVFPGPRNKGIFVKLPDFGEEYQITHPTANITGLIRGSPYVAISDYCWITCRSQNTKRYRVITSYLDESWLSKAKYGLEGVIHEVEGDGEKENEWTKIKHVPADKIVAKFEGSWRGEIKITRVRQEKATERSAAPVANPSTLINLALVPPLPKIVRSVSRQDEAESRRHWSEVTSAIKEHRFNDATKVKLALEQKQRDIAAQRKQNGEEFVPLYFEETVQEEGRPVLGVKGLDALEREFKAEDY